MAIINSILIGKGGGKIGNVIFQSYNKKTLARQLNTSISVVPTTLQIRQRQRIKNIAIAYNYNNDFLSGLKNTVQNYGSIYNYCVSNFMIHADFTHYDNSRYCWNSFRFRSYGDKKYISIDSIEQIIGGLESGSSLIKFHAINEQIKSDSKIHFYCIDGENQLKYTLIKNLTLQEITSGQIIISKFNEVNIECSCYIIYDNDKKCSDILIS